MPRRPTRPMPVPTPAPSRRVPLARCALALWLALSCGPAGDGDDARDDTPTGPRTVVLVSIDTLRPERLGVYGGAPGVSPVIDALADEALVFDQALAPSPWTLPSHMTMLTGLDPLAHGVINETTRASDDITTLAESLSAAGFSTGAFTDGGFVRGIYGFTQGFDVYDDQRNEKPGGVNGFPRVMPRALDWLDEHESDDVFLFLHSFDAHTPYDETEPDILERFRSRPVSDGPHDHLLNWARHLFKQEKVGITGYARMGGLLNDYDAGVFEADYWLGELLDLLREQGRFRDALIVVTSDHGESFFDHGLHVGHGLALTDDEVAIPLLLRLPGGEAGGQRRDELVSLVDLHRTVLDVLGLPAPDEVQGESLLGLARGRTRRTDYVLGFSQNMRAWSLVKNGLKYITPVGVKPMVIAERHLGARTPPGLPPAEAPEDCYELDGVDLCYDTVGDPLGMLDVLPSAEVLYDRDDDPREQRDLARSQDLLRQLREQYDAANGRLPTNAELAALADGESQRALLDRALEVEQLLGLMRKAYEAESARSRALAARFQTEAVALDPAEQRVLASLGYLQSGNRDDLKGVSLQMREWMLNPHRAPDVAPLEAADRAVHRVRVQLAAGQALTGNDARVLFGAGEAYIEWADAHPEYRRRVQWRLTELATVARGGGLALPMDAWAVHVGVTRAEPPR